MTAWIDMTPEEDDDGGHLLRRRLALDLHGDPEAQLRDAVSVAGEVVTERWTDVEALAAKVLAEHEGGGGNELGPTTQENARRWTQRARARANSALRSDAVGWASDPRARGVDPTREHPGPDRLGQGHAGGRASAPPSRCGLLYAVSSGESALVHHGANQTAPVGPVREADAAHRLFSGVCVKGRYGRGGDWCRQVTLLGRGGSVEALGDCCRDDGRQNDDGDQE